MDDNLYLDIYRPGHKREYEFLSLFIMNGNKDNKDILSYAQQIRDTRYKELVTDEHGFINSQNKRVSFVGYFEQYAKSKPNGSAYDGALKHLRKFLGEKDIQFKDKDRQWLNEFAGYLKTKLHGNTPQIYFLKIKEALSKAVEEGFTKVKNPTKETTYSNLLQ